MYPTSPPSTDRYQTVISLLREILQRVDALEKSVDQIDRDLRPYGDGTARRERA